jgi:O-antigen/teichoic acid export membrane protein
MLNFFFTRSEFSKNVLTLVSGTVISQMIVIGLSPVLSRLYTPEEFGMLGTYMSIVSAVSIFSAGRYELAIVLPEKDEEAINLFAIAFIINAGISLLSFICSITFIHFFAGKIGLDEHFVFWLYFIPLFVFFIGSYQVLTNWASRKKNYRSISYYRISNSFFTASTNTALGVLRTGSAGLFIGNLLGSAVSAFIFLGTLFSELKSLLKFVSAENILLAARKYKKFPLTNSLQAASDMLQVNGIIYFTSYFFTHAVVGSFSYTIRVLQAPMNFIGGAIALVFYQQASSMKSENKNIGHLISATMKKSMLIALPVLIILFVFGPELFAFVFGAKWREAGVYARILSPWIFLDFIRSTVAQVVFVTGRQKKLLLFSIISNLLLVVAMLYGGFIAKDVKKGFIAFSVLQSLMALVVLYWFNNISHQDKKTDI